jgi:hypothetical protein
LLCFAVDAAGRKEFLIAARRAFGTDRTRSSFRRKQIRDFRLRDLPRLAEPPLRARSGSRFPCVSLAVRRASYGPHTTHDRIVPYPAKLEGMDGDSVADRLCNLIGCGARLLIKRDNVLRKATAWTRR